MQNNYNIIHCHTQLSNGTTIIDSIDGYEAFIDKAKEHGMKSIIFTEHGNTLSWYHKKTYAEKQGLKYIHAIEAYVTETHDELIRDNRHICIYCKNKEGFYELNELISKSFNRNDVKVIDDVVRFYFYPRISIDEILNLSDNFYFSSACLGGTIAPSASATMKEKMFKFFYKNKDRCFLEIQHHNVKEQIDYNKQLIALHNKFDIPLIVGTDTHCIDQNSFEGRKTLQERKKIHFDNEDGWDLCFRSYGELISAFEETGIDMEYVYEGIENTHKLVDGCEEYEIDISFKYPKLSNDPLATIKQKILKGMKDKQKYIKDIPMDILKNRINEELAVYQKTNLIDFTLLQKYIRDWEKENGIFCGPGRGSVSGSMIAYLLDITEMNSIKFDLNFFRYANPSRVTLADIDSDYYEKDKKKIDEFILKDKLNNPKLYTCQIVTFNTIALKGAIRDVFPTFGHDQNVISMVANAVEDGDLDKYREMYSNEFKMVDILNGTIVSLGNHPAGSIISDRNIFREFGTFTTKDSLYPVSCVNMDEIGHMGYVKLDILGLDNVGLINETCKLANIPRLTPDNVNLEDEAVWKDIAKDTIGVFQMESPLGYKTLSNMFSEKTLSKIEETNHNISKIKLMSFANGLIRPGCASFRDEATNGEFYHNGLKELDDFLSPTLGRLVMQEQIMMFLVKFCGYSMAESDNVRRAISKKAGTESLLPEIESRFVSYTSQEYGVPVTKCKEIIKPFIQAILDASSYGFSFNHSDAYSCIGYICGYLRYYYPLEFITTFMNIFGDNHEKVERITNYAQSVGITFASWKFRHSKSSYFFDKDNKIIYKGLSNIKSIGEQVGDDLYMLRNNEYDSFVDLLCQLLEIKSINFGMLKILIMLDYFEEFGKSQKLLTILDYFDRFYEKKQFSTNENIVFESEYKLKYTSNEKKLIKSYEVDIEKIGRYCGKKTPKRYSEFDYISFLKDIEKEIENKSIPLKLILRVQSDFVGNIVYSNKDLKSIYYVIDYKTYNDKCKPYMKLYNLQNGEIISTNTKNRFNFLQQPFKLNSVIKVNTFKEEYKKKKIVNDKGKEKWVDTDEKKELVEEWITLSY